MQKTQFHLHKAGIIFCGVLLAGLIAFSATMINKQPAKEAKVSASASKTTSTINNSDVTSSNKQAESKSSVSAVENSSSAYSNAQNCSEETTLKEAISIAYQDAIKWSKNAQLIRAGSTDAMDDPTLKSGDSGKRKTWNISFTDTKSTHEYIVFVAGGKVALHKQSEQGQKTTILNKDFSLNSIDALKIAVDQKKLKPGNPDKDWAIGYHFTLEHVSYYSEPDKKHLVISVHGISPKGNFARVDVDAKTGKILYAGEKTYDKDGNGVWTDF